ncbi:hypothetical protein [Lutibacter flavus]|uniref:DinB superfamily protein n=1 Tax=Lutibacter flavus TaxID=691689 RepID=A0A238X1M9_9FLAO|nr:hypothetical protein [Lutibacter flavus]SNR52757.1 hypothetical protein SAMN04488111_1473 [Lutibacter flavus]
MKQLTFLFISLILIVNIKAQENQKQDELPYYEVPEYTNEYSAGSVAARMVDGLGFRYRWATENLNEEDLNYKPNENSRSIEETIDHILGLSRVIVNSTLKLKTDFTKEQPTLSYAEKRKVTLENLKKASDILIRATDLESFKIEFVYDGGSAEYPFWNQINGPIADAIWHSGQIASFRRSSGNPISPKVQFLQGTIKE